MSIYIKWAFKSIVDISSKSYEKNTAVSISHSIHKLSRERLESEKGKRKRGEKYGPSYALRVFSNSLFIPSMQPADC